mmetsp:Transcript_1556/g.4586  ORF Transcript_1556/g.4586 Transcript_1556/m.4586 type:complete len:178 (-) Transcript_1556:540-1073(-)
MSESPTAVTALQPWVADSKLKPIPRRRTLGGPPGQLQTRACPCTKRFALFKDSVFRCARLSHRVRTRASEHGFSVAGGQLEGEVLPGDVLLRCPPASDHILAAKLQRLLIQASRPRSDRVHRIAQGVFAQQNRCTSRPPQLFSPLQQSPPQLSPPPQQPHSPQLSAPLEPTPTEPLC